MLTHLPLELIIHILSYLPLPALAACQRSHPALHALITSSACLRYIKALHSAALAPNPHCPSALSINERLGMLARLERGWWDFRIDSVREVSVGNQIDPGGVHWLGEGMFILGGQDRRALHCYPLPGIGEEGEELGLRRVEVCEEDDGVAIVGFAMARYELDLMAIVTSTPQDDTFAIDIRLLEASSGAPHPLAKQPVFHVTHSPGPRPEVAVEVVGDNLALVVTHPRPENEDEERPEDHLCIYAWRTGVASLHVRAPPRTYTSLLFLTPTLLLLPNTHANTLEYWAIAPSPCPLRPQPLGALALPPLAPPYTLTHTAFRCAPNPTVYDTPFSPGPFHADPGEAIAMLTLRIGAGPGAGEGLVFVIFVHRGTLVRLCPEPRSPGTAGATVPWDAWGPPVTRCFTLNARITRWGATTAGQRYAMSSGGGGGAAGALVYLDFGVVRGRRLGSVRGAKPASAGGSGGKADPHVLRHAGGTVRTWFETRASAVRHPAFRGEVVSGLGYMVCALDRARGPVSGAQGGGQGEGTGEGYDGVLMYEEGLVGVKADEVMRIGEVEVLRVGAS